MTPKLKNYRILIHFLAICLIGSGIWNSCLAQGTIYVSGTYPGKTIWNADTVKVTGSVSVDTLMIEPGTLVEFQGQYGIGINYYLEARGELGDTILFTVKDTTGFSNPDVLTGSWGGMGGLGMIVLKYSKVQYVKHPKKAIISGVLLCMGRGPLIQNSCIINNMANGIYLDISNINITNSIIANNRGIGIYDHIGFIKVYGCTIRNNAGGGIFSRETGKVFVENSTIELNGNYGIRASEPYGFYLNNSIIQNNIGNGVEINDLETRWRGIVSNNIIKFNKGSGFDGGICGIHFVNNLIFGNNKAGIRQMMGFGAGTVFINNTIVKNAYGIELNEAPLYMYNCICRYNNQQNIRCVLPEQILHGKIFNSNIEGINPDDFSGAFIDNIDADPLFVDTANYDFHLKDISSCIDAGTVDTTGLYLPHTDLDGKPRVFGGRIDMGAYECNKILPNAPPRIEKLKDQAFLTSSINRLVVKYYDPDSGDFCTLLGVFSDIPEIKVLDPMDSLSFISFVIAPDAGWQGTGTIQIQVTDNHGNIGTQEFKVDISNRVCGYIKKNAIWDLDTIKVTCDVIVNRDVTLTIKPGTVVAFSNNCLLNVLGSILAVGNKDSLIIFTSIDTSGFFNQTYPGWKGIRLTGNGKRAEFRFCEYKYAKNEENGGALYGGYYPLKITNCKFYNNYSQTRGGALYSAGKVSDFEKNVFANNFAQYAGGAVYFTENKIDIINSLFVNNYAKSGAAIYAGSGARLISNTIVGNNAETGSPGAYIAKGKILNCIIWGNESGIFKNQVTIDDSGTVANCIIKGGIAGISYLKSAPHISGTIYSNDPLFINEKLSDFHLTDTSAGINSGTMDTTGLSIPGTDLDGYPRIFQGSNKIVDIGAYEFQDEPQNRQPEILFPQNLYMKTSVPDREVVKYFDPDGDDARILSIISADENLQILNVSGDTSGSCFEIVPNENWIGRTSISIQVQDSYGTVTEHRCNVIVGYIACGKMSDSTLWDADTIHVTCDITVPENSLLIIAPGTIVLFHNYSKITVLGSIRAIGKPSDKIFFTSDDSAIFKANINKGLLSGKIGWGGITIDNQTSVFHHCIFKYVSGSVLSCPGIEIRNCDFKYNVSSPISAFNSLIRKCTFTFNEGAIYIQGNSIIDSCSFISNHSVEVGAIRLWNGNQIVSNCLFNNNSCRYGACLYTVRNSQGSIRISRNIFTNNHTDYGGTGAAILNSGVLFDNNLIFNNHGANGRNLSMGGSGGVYSYGNPVLINNTIVYNTVTGGPGGGLCIDESSTPYIYNTILFGNTSDTSENQIGFYNLHSHIIPNVEITNSLIREGKDKISGKGNILRYENNLDIDPLLLLDTLTSPFTPGFLSLSDFSPCINVGTPDTTGLNLPGIDLLGNPRIFDGRIDMGAYEYQQDNFHILKQPVSQTICQKASALFETEAIGSVLGYQWQKNGSDIPSANQDTFAIDSVTLSDSGYYNCIIVADDKTVSTDTVLLSVPNPEPPSSKDTAICEGQEVPDLTASGEQITWYSDAELSNVVYSGSTFNTGKTDHGLYVYYATQSVSGCESAAGIITLAILELPVISLGKDSSIFSNRSFVLGPFPDCFSYLWYDDSQNPFLEISGNDLGLGSHTISVVVTDTNACRSSDTVIIHVVPITDLNVPKDNNRLDLFPNPTNGMLYVELSEFVDENIIVKIYNQQGLEIASNKMHVDNRDGNISLNLTSIPAGIYYLQIITNHNKYIGKIVVE
jgi:predicted outer membrane repeat protein